jgi:hypothetical protein
VAQDERYGTRGLEYSVWHRRASTRRFVGSEYAQLLAMIDLDAIVYVEYDDGRKEPLALLELARDVGQAVKPATVTARLAEIGHIPAFVVLYTLADTPNPAQPQWRDIASFRVRQLTPQRWTDWQRYSPQAWAEYLLRLRHRQAANLDESVTHPQTQVCIGVCRGCQWRGDLALLQAGYCALCRQHGTGGRPWAS